VGHMGGERSAAARPLDERREADTGACYDGRLQPMGRGGRAGAEPAARSPVSRAPVASEDHRPSPERPFTGRHLYADAALPLACGATGRGADVQPGDGQICGRPGGRGRRCGRRQGGLYLGVRASPGLDPATSGLSHRLASLPLPPLLLLTQTLPDRHPPPQVRRHGRLSARAHGPGRPTCER
jgi:hypothetical protein